MRAITPEKVLVLRTCAADGSSSHGFIWPEAGEVACRDWKPTPACGNGLHGWLWGEGDGSLGHWQEDARWLVVEVESTSIVDLTGKVKFPAGIVVYCGDRLGATVYLAEHGAAGRLIIGGTATAGDRGTATAGYGGTATAGDRGTATVGDSGTATAGDRGTATAGYGGTATAGDSGTATAGDRGTATAGYGGTATAGDRGTATAGDRGTATAGYGGTATAGDGGTATAGDRGTATAGYGGSLIIRRWDVAAGRYRTVAADVGENGIEANVAYRLNEAGLFVPVTSAVTV